MLWTLFVVLLLAWMICFVFVGITSVAIHFLLVGAALVLLSRFIGSKKTS